MYILHLFIAKLFFVFNKNVFESFCCAIKTDASKYWENLSDNDDHLAQVELTRVDNYS